MSKRLQLYIACNTDDVLVSYNLNNVIYHIVYSDDVIIITSSEYVYTSTVLWLPMHLNFVFTSAQGIILANMTQTGNFSAVTLKFLSSWFLILVSLYSHLKLLIKINFVEINVIFVFVVPVCPLIHSGSFHYVVLLLMQAIVSISL